MASEQEIKITEETMVRLGLFESRPVAPMIIRAIPETGMNDVFLPEKSKPKDTWAQRRASLKRGR